MLENILSEINSNLVRIANALESKKERPVGIPQNNIQHVQTPAISVPQTTNTENQVVPVQTQAPVAQQPVEIPQAIPTTQNAGFTMEQLAAAMSNAVNAGKMNTVLEVLHSFGVQALTQVNPADYSKLATLLKEKGIEI